MNLLKDVVKQNPHYAKGQKVMFDLCVTRWVENLDGYNRFSVSLPFIIETLEVIGYKLHLEKYPDWKEWDMESRRRATSLLRNILIKYQHGHSLIHQKLNIVSKINLRVKLSRFQI